MTATTLQRPTPPRRWPRVLAVVLLVLVGTPVACDALWRLQHPAPLGRSAEAVERALTRQVPPGTSIDSAETVLRAARARYWRFPTTHPRMGKDSLAAGGPALIGGLHELDASFCMMHGAGIRLYFDSAGRLARRVVEPWVTAC